MNSWASPAIIVETTAAGRFAVRCRPMLCHRELERSFPAAWQALDWAELIAGEIGACVIDRTGAAA